MNLAVLERVSEDNPMGCRHMDLPMMLLPQVLGCLDPSALAAASVGSSGLCCTSDLAWREIFRKNWGAFLSMPSVPPCWRVHCSAYARGDKEAYFAKLAEVAERYDDMAYHIEALAKLRELTVDERNLFKSSLSLHSLKTSWLVIKTTEQQKWMQDYEEEAQWAREYRWKIQTDLHKMFDRSITLMDSYLIPNATPESKVFYLKMKADNYKLIAEINDGDVKVDALQNARLSYDESQKVAEKGLDATHPIRLGLALAYSAFQFDLLSNPNEACKLARTALEDAAAELDNMTTDTSTDSIFIMKVLRDNLTQWVSD